jgi:hypothetical protein
MWINNGWVSFSGAEVAESAREARQKALEAAAQACELHYAHWMQDKQPDQARVAWSCAESIRRLMEQ